MTTTATLKVGDLVHVDPTFPGAARSVLGRTFKVTKVNAKNVQAAPAEGGGRGINYPKESLLPGEAGSAGTVVGVPFVPTVLFGLGEVVTMTRPMPGTPADLPYVVIKDNGDTRVNVAALGNTDGRYVRVARAALVKRDAAWLTEYLVAKA